MRIGEYFRKQKNLSPHIIQTALEIQKVTGQKIGRILVDLGAITHNELLEYLAKHNADALVEERTVFSTIDPFFLLRTQTVVLSESKNTLYVASFQPNEVKRLEKSLGKTIKLSAMNLETFYQELAKIHEACFKKQDNETTDPNQILKKLLNDAINFNASDIHIETMPNYLVVRIRIDGVLKIWKVYKFHVADPLIARIKGLSNLDIAARQVPQDGAFTYKVTTSKEIQVRVSTVPQVYGETVVMRLLDKDKVNLSIEQLGIDAQAWRKAISQHDGVILVTGATGSGKTTTLYATLLALNRIGKNIITIEDPVEYQFPFIRQVQVNRVLNLDFAAFLRSAMRQDPDIILVGEVRDPETAHIMVQAAETGHLVFATLHSNNVKATFSRLKDLDISIHELKYLLRAIQSQTLIRKLCRLCKGKGCDACYHSGYTGRLLVAELVIFNEQVLHEWLEEGKEPIYKTIPHRAVEYYLEGLTDERELDRVFGMDQNDIKKYAKELEEMNTKFLT